MEQIISFLAEYAGEIAAVTGSFTTILLCAALHRIRKIENYIQEIAGNTAEGERGEKEEPGMQAISVTENAGQAVSNERQSAGNAGWAVPGEGQSAEKSGQAASNEGQSAGNAGQAVPGARQSAGKSGQAVPGAGQVAELPQTDGSMPPGQLIDEVLGEVFS